ncbi:MAG: HAMP domain-containing sensor histidine kinase [Desulfuromonadaceae bacterium]|nr:HAMP domain-containing sensor histidine kinase [Desulfuromonadaceae bacterium]
MRKRLFRRSMPSHLTLRTRLALWSAGLLFIFSIATVVTINVVTPILASDSYSAQLDPVPALPEEELLEYPSEPITVKITEGLGEDISADDSQSSTSIVRDDIFRKMRFISLISLGIVVVLGGLGAFWIAGRALKPVKEITQAASKIDSKTLDTRLTSNIAENEFHALTTSLNQMLDRLEKSFDQQGRFVADVAHELRTPLAGLRSSLDSLYMDSPVTLNDYEQTVAVVERSLTRIQRVVGDLLLLTTEVKSLPKSEIILGPLVDEVLVDLKPLAEQNQVALRYDGDEALSIRANPTAIAVIIRNLVENGIRYNVPGGEVSLNTVGNETWAKLVVTDTGIGIPPEHREHIFERFYRVHHPQSQHNGGSGLGLSIVAHLVEIHGGSVTVESSDSGSKFTVRLPL